MSMEIKPTQKDAEYMDKWTRRSAITHGISDERLMEMCNAERAGRCLVLPFDIGSSVFDIGLGSINEWEVTGFSIGDCNSDPDFDYGDPYNGELVVHTKNDSLCAKLEFPESTIGSYVFSDYNATEDALNRKEK